MGISAIHWNHNQLCAIDIETTGLDPFYHEMIQIAILPLDSFIKPRKDILPFYINLRPENPERFDREAQRINKLLPIIEQGHDREKAKDMLESWMKKLHLATTEWGTPKKIIPLGQNYSFDKSFILKWLGHELYELYFDYHYRDTMIAANYLNDQADLHARQVPYNRVSLTALTKIHKVENITSHDALSDAMMAAEVYRKMCISGLF